MNTGNNPSISWSRKIPTLQDKKEFKDLVKDLKEIGMVEESTLPWLNPVVLVRKKNGKLSFCLDFKKVNNVVDFDEFEIPKIQELLTLLNGKKYFSSIDLKTGFFQAPIKKVDMIKTAFYTSKRLIKFKKMPHSYKNSSAIFQRTMKLVLGDLLEKFYLVYIDDILIYGNPRKNTIRI